MTEIWIGWTVIFAASWYLSSYNVRNYNALVEVSSWLLNEFRPFLLEHKYLNEYRFIASHILPRYNRWANTTSLYGICVFALQGVLIGTAATMVFFTNPSYILVVVSTVLFATVVVLTPDVFKLRKQLNNDREMLSDAYFDICVDIELRDRSNAKENVDIEN